MNTKEKIEQDAVVALKNKESRLSILRMLKTALQNAIIEKRGKENNPQVELTEEEVLSIIRRQIKQLKDALVDFAKANRTELLEKAQEEIIVLEQYLPAELTVEEVAKLVDEAIKELSATAKDLGKVMGLVMKKAGGRAEGNTVKELVSKKLV
ncbi:MAG: hypothetical protein UT86_C0002G0044 [Candidatus Magasanikbacteria bacterium GW2011_GWC2_40_17]|uniref:GatB/YqeY domain-containing protein n=1 Tax=Candidatus Magasanikbacteria bacterium GW2011_GWA2_42_32 TaxID=1619039 RepID=A0A0G1A7F3_9BACT|nr:MAG: hypothetical protein UT86_C0002G0044 [Candidatus Magasanikbacteria bacterium GW2011_GWC2_40_17]KKS56879.1 MAG: hypothetical protein UV20_C0005G0044 [Candidatus Magasanikbacteria bacterium GW2011_GWA2_42_32]OGH85663.1 MAG: hypothetical protein A2294_00185 [Candidatus Magasanikbacteria bacterium RIFOXYB2_FULL_38_10]